MKVLLTGGTGFIGSHTHKGLRRSGYQVKLFEGDIRKVEDWERSLLGGEVLVHLAGIRTESETDFEVNVGGITRLFDAIEIRGKVPRRIVYGSSQAVYKGCEPPFDEKKRAIPTTAYGRSKLEAEKVMIMKGKGIGVPVVILRFSTVVGVGIRADSRMSGPLMKWMNSAVKGDPIVVFQDGNQKRDYVHVRDAVKAILLAMKKLPEGIYNVGGGRDIKLIDLAKMVRKVCGNKSEIRIVGGGSTDSDPEKMISDVSKLLKFGWKPVSSVNRAVSECVSVASIRD